MRLRAPAFPLTRRRLTAAAGLSRKGRGGEPRESLSRRERGRGRGYGLSGEAVFPHALGGACPWACRPQDPGAEKAPAGERRGAAPAFPLTRRPLTAAARPLPEGRGVEARIKPTRRASSSGMMRVIVGEKRASSSGQIGGGVRFDERKWRFRTDPANAGPRLDFWPSA